MEVCRWREFISFYVICHFSLLFFFSLRVLNASHIAARRSMHIFFIFFGFSVLLKCREWERKRKGKKAYQKLWRIQSSLHLVYIGTFVPIVFGWMRLCVHFAKWFEDLFVFRRFNYILRVQARPGLGEQLRELKRERVKRRRHNWMEYIYVKCVLSIARQYAQFRFRLLAFHFQSLSFNNTGKNQHMHFCFECVFFSVCAKRQRAREPEYRMKCVAHAHIFWSKFEYWISS